jgi:hypothetical protein
MTCPDCGAMPPDKDKREQPAMFCEFCGTKLVERSELPNDIWKDPAVRERLKEGHPAFDIAVLRCPDCDRLGYYNEGSTFSCRFCDLSFLVVTEDEEHPDGYRTVSSDEVIRLDDTITECSDGYHNSTI